MKTVYLDSDFICHLDNEDGRIPFETDFFDRACIKFIEGYRAVPQGYTWTREDGEVFIGEMIAPAIPYSEIMPYQDQYTEDLDNMISLEDAAELVELVYLDDLAMIG